MDKQTYTYQTRFTPLTKEENFLCDLASLMNQVERKLFADFNSGISLNSNKSNYINKYGVTARHFNSIKIFLQGKISSIASLQEDYINDTKLRLQKTKRNIKSLTNRENKTTKQKQAQHQRKRLLSRQENKLTQLIQDKKNNKVHICFGSKKLFKKQFFLKENNYESHQEWLEDWQNSRNNQFNLIGSKDESSGNQSCTAIINEDGNINLKIRVPNILRQKYGNYITIENIKFEYGHDVILSAIQENLKRNQLQKKSMQSLHGDLYKQHGQAITYKFIKDEKGWRVFATTEKVAPKKISKDNVGVIGVDINEAHLAITETDRTGNPVNSFNVPLCTYGKSSNQAKAIIGDACKQIVDYACLTNKPLIMEQLDFSTKKRNLKGNGSKKARMLSSFSYQLITNTLASRAFRFGINLYTINPAYTSIIGRVKFAKLYKLSVHNAAALVIGRRFLKFSERLPRCLDSIPDNKGGHFTLPELVKIPGKHVWTSWAKVLKNFKSGLAVQYQMLRSTCKGKYVLAGESLGGFIDEPPDMIPF